MLLFPIHTAERFSPLIFYPDSERISLFAPLFKMVPGRNPKEADNDRNKKQTGTPLRKISGRSQRSGADERCTDAERPEGKEMRGIRPADNWSYVKKKYKLNMPFLGWLTLPKLLLFPLTLHNTPPHIDQAKDIHNDCGSALYYKMFRYIQIPTYMHAGS